MTRLACALLLSTVLLLAGDVTGKWSGSLVLQSNEGDRTDSAYAVLKQDGTTITGTAGGNEGDQHPIRNGKIEGDNVTFDVVAGERLFKLRMKIEGDTLAGDVKRQRDNGETVNAKISLKRVQ